MGSFDATVSPLFWDLGFGARVTLWPAFLDRVEGEDLARWLASHVTWEQGSVRFFGKLVPEPRLTAWFGDRDYTYSGRTLRRCPWPERLSPLRSRVEAAAESPLNTVLLNRYRDGRDSMGFHSDDERELGPNPVVASLSLGESRRFVLEPKKASGGERLELVLEHGSLLVMGGTCQHTFRHAVPKQRAVRGERLNLTFRYVLEPPIGA